MNHILLGAIAGWTIFLGLPVARMRGVTERLRGMLALLSVGVLLFLIIEVGYQAMELVETSAKGADLKPAITHGLVFILGLSVGLIGLAAFESRKLQSAPKTTPQKLKSGSKKVLPLESEKPADVATMIAIGIGLHNFTEGLTIGQSFSSGALSLGWVLVIGFALHNATEGFGIAAPLAGQSVRWSRLVGLGLIAGLPTAVGAWMGGFWVNPTVELLFLSLALGSLIYVIRELFRLRFAHVSPVAAMNAVVIGLLIGFATELIVEVAQARETARMAAQRATNTVSVRFENGQAQPNPLSIKRGQTLMIENGEAQTLIFEGNGLFVGEVSVASQSQVPMTITGNPGSYTLTDERNRSVVVPVTVKAGEKIAALTEEVNAVGALTVLEGHIRASRALHNRAVSGQSPDAALDLKRAGKHAAHPQHELLMGKEPDALTLQKLLRKHHQLDPLNQALSAYVQVSGNKAASPTEVEKRYQALLTNVEQARKQIAASAYDTPDFRKRAAQFVLETAASEYTTATEGGTVNVTEPGVPGKDNVFEYQDARGFLQATHELLFPQESNAYATLNVHRALDQLLRETLNSWDPPKQPKPASEVQEAIKDMVGNMYHTVQITF